MSKPSYPLIGWNNTGTKSNIYKLTGLQVIGFITPATIVSTSITFNIVTSENNNPVVPILVADSTGSAVSFTTTASKAQYYGFSQDQIAKFTGIELIQMVSGSSEAANSAFQLVLVPRQY